MENAERRRGQDVEDALSAPMRHEETAEKTRKRMDEEKGARDRGDRGTLRYRH